MGSLLRLLLVADSGHDALIHQALSRGGLEPTWERVETADGLSAALAAKHWDAIVSDYALAVFGAPAALDLVRAFDPDLPFIVVSGAVGEDVAVAMMRATASDYVLKHDLVRLAPAVEREVREAQGRHAARAAARAAVHLAAVVESSDDAIMSKSLDGVVTSWNPAAEALYGWPAPEAVGRHISFIVPPDKAGELAEHIALLRVGGRVGYYETVRLHRDGHRIEVAMTMSSVRDIDGRLIGVSKTARDIRERKLAEAALRQSEERYRGLIESIPALVWVYDAAGRPLLHNHRWYDYTGQSREAVAAGRWHEALHPDDAAEALAAWKRSIASGEPYSAEYRLRRADGAYRWFLAQGAVQRGPGGEAQQWVGVCSDIDDRRRAEDEQRRTADLLQGVADGTPYAVFVKDLAGKYLLFNRAAARFVGRAAEDVLGHDDTFLFGPDDARRVMERDRRVRESGDPETEEEVLTAAGVTRTYLATKAPHRDRGGVVVGVLGTSRDITEQKRVAQALRASETRYRRLFEAAQDGILIVDAESRRVFDVNPFLIGILGYSREELIGKELWELGLFRDIEANREAFTTLQEDGYVRYGNLPLRAKGGRLIDVEFVSNTYDVGGVRVVQCNVRDNTERRRAEHERAEMLTRLDLQVERMPLAYLLSGPDFRYTRWNPAAERTFGFTQAEVLGRHPFEVIVPPESQSQVADVFARLAAGDMDAHGECENVTRDGRAITCEWYNTPLFYPDGTFQGVLSLAQDVTARRMAEKELHLRDRAIRAVNGGLLITDATRPDHPIIYTSPGFERLTGYTAGEVVGRNCRLLQGPGTDPEAVNRVREAVRDGLTCDIELLNYRKDGTPFWNKLLISPVQDQAGRLTHFIAFQSDVTGRKGAEATLRDQDELLRNVIAHIPAGVFWKGRDGRFLGANDRFAQDQGFSSTGVVVGKTDADLPVAQAEAEAFRAADLRVMALGEPVLNVAETQTRSDGRKVHLLVSKVPLRDAVGRVSGVLGVYQDVTEYRRLEEQFRQAQKMEAVGQLAAGVAHDFNNMLTIINGYSDLLLQELPPGDPSREPVEEIAKAGERSAGLTRQLLVFSRQQVLAPRVLSLNDVVAEAEKMLRRLLGEDVRLATALGPAPWPVLADAGQVEQVLMNLVVNARDAMPTGGRLTIETRNVELDESYARAHPDARPGPHVVLSVADTGSGMSPEVLARVFEPFYTTKGLGKGTGLGLATVYGIVKQSGGHVAVYSEVGVGTTFKVYLPRATKPKGGSKLRPGLLTPPRGTETVLLAEDDAGVRALTRHVLAGCGYAVLEAADGEEAVRVAAAHAGPIDLLVTDVVMPGVGGRSAAELVAARHPGVRVLFVSGYTDDAVIRHGVLREGVDFLQKPFSRVALAVKVREVLDAPPRTARH